MIIYRAQLVSNHYEFEGFGLTEDEAVETMKKALRLHGKQCGIGQNWWQKGYDWDVQAFQIGTPYRDSMEMKA